MTLMVSPSSDMFHFSESDDMFCGTTRTKACCVVTEARLVWSLTAQDATQLLHCIYFGVNNFLVIFLSLWNYSTYCNEQGASNVKQLCKERYNL